MFLIPGPLIALATFPGVIVHELAHQMVCRWFGVPVLEVCYFRFGNPAGYVVHEPANKNYQALLIAIGPFLVNTILGGLVAFPAALPVIRFGTGDFLDYFLIWLGVSIAMHAIPSIDDAKSLWQTVKPVSSVSRFIAGPLVGAIYLAGIGRIFWLDLFYGIGVAVGLPTLLVTICAKF